MKKDSLFNQFGIDSPHLKVNIFNNYRIIGLLEEIAFVATKGCVYMLNYNHTTNQYYLFKRFTSGKLHIDFFKNEENVPQGILYKSKKSYELLFIKNNLIAKSTGYDIKTLHFDPIKDLYFAKWTSNNQQYSLEFSNKNC